MKEKKNYERHKKTCNFARFKTLQAYGNDIKNGIIMIVMANSKQLELAEEINDLQSRTRLPICT